MSGEKRYGDMKGISVGSSHAFATIGAKYGPTGREILADRDYELASKWSELTEDGELESHPAKKAFIDALAQTKIAAGITFDCYRGRILSVKDEKKWTSMGPPLEGTLCPDGRYNFDKKPVLYLTELKKSVPLEALGIGELWAQKYSVPLRKLKIADFSIGTSIGFVNHAFWFAELAGNKDVKIKFAYSQFLAGIISKHFDGMIIPGVRGKNESLYRNLVIFQPHPGWINWVDTAEAPELLSN